MPLKNENLTRNQKIVLDLLKNTKDPLGAYTILTNIEKKGIKAPLQVYRALDKLIESGKVHKIESKNAYIICKNSNCNSLKSTSFLICEKCDSVSEIKRNNLKQDLSILSEESGSNYANHNLEIYGLCKSCGD